MLLNIIAKLLKACKDVLNAPNAPNKFLSSSSRFGTEERHGGFPFVFNQQFKLALAFTEREVLTAVDGFNFFSYNWRTPSAMMNLVGFKVTAINGLVVQITGVDHVQTGDPACTGFEKYSRHDYECA